MTEPGSAATPRHVMDGWGNIWCHYNDKGYLRLQVTTEPGRALAEIVQETGVVTALVVASPTDLLREKVTRNAVH